MNYGSYVLSNSFRKIFPILFEILPGFQARATQCPSFIWFFFCYWANPKVLPELLLLGTLPEFPKIFTCASHVRDLTEVLTISSARLSKKSSFLQFMVSGSQCSSPLSPDTSHGVLRSWKCPGKKVLLAFCPGMFWSVPALRRSCSCVWVSAPQQRVPCLPERMGKPHCLCHLLYNNFTIFKVAASLFFYFCANTNCLLVNSELRNI